MSKNPTIKEKILSLLRRKPNSRPVDIAAAVGINVNAISVYLVNLKRAGLVNNPKRGAYVLTEKGLQYAQNLPDIDLMRPGTSPKEDATAIKKGKFKEKESRYRILIEGTDFVFEKIIPLNKAKEVIEFVLK